MRMQQRNPETGTRKTPIILVRYSMSERIVGSPAARETCLLLEHAPEGESAERLHLALHPSWGIPRLRPARKGKSLSARRGRSPQRGGSRGVVAQHDSRIQESTLFSGDEENGRNGRSASRTTGSICFPAAGKRGCIPGCMPG